MKSGEKDGRPDILTILDVDNEFYSGCRFLLEDGWDDPRSFKGTCEIDRENKEITLNAKRPNTKTYFALYEVSEDENRFSLRLEFSESSMPSSFTDDAFNSVVRSQFLPKREAADQFSSLEYS